MDIDLGACMFCNEPFAADQAVNLAFMDHLDATASCQDAFDAWTTNMQTDFLGD